MNLLTPSTGFLLWTFIILFSLIISLFLIVKIWKRIDFDQTTKLLWTILILIAPFLGIILFLIFSDKKRSDSQ